MKKKLLIAAILLLALALFTRHYSLIEREDPLPADVQSMLDGWSGVAYASQEEQSYLLDEVLRPHSFLERGDSGETVRLLQEKLYELGFLSDTADGMFGEQTERAVSALKDYLSARRSEQARAAEAKRVAVLEDTRASLEAQFTGRAAEVRRANRAAFEEMRRALEPSERVAGAAAEGVTEEEETFYSAGVSRSLWEQMTQEGFLSGEGTLASGARGDRVARLQNRLRTLNYLLDEADGEMGAQTKTAVTAFQKYNALPQTGEADDATQALLYSAGARAGKKADGRYVLKISVDRQRVYAYEWDVMAQDYATLARTMVCSTGLNDTPTPRGTFTNTAPVARWGYFPKFDCWAQYLYRINGSILFHSVLYDSADESTLRWGSVNRLGSKASHGCVRLSVEDARWIYTNCPGGTTVVVY